MSGALKRMKSTREFITGGRGKKKARIEEDARLLPVCRRLYQPSWDFSSPQPPPSKLPGISS
jgi:hypothetical protein